MINEVVGSPPIHKRTKTAGENLNLKRELDQVVSDAFEMKPNQGRSQQNSDALTMASSVGKNSNLSNPNLSPDAK